MAITLNNNLATMKVGEYVWCKYTASSGVVGVFSEFATKTDADVVGQEIPVTSTATPNGYFRFIMVEDWNGKNRLVADRNIQHSISWDTLNTSGIASGSGLPLTSISEEPTSENGFSRKSYAVRLLTGGITSNDKDNEWDNYIVGSDLSGVIVSGDNAVWNWSGIASATSTTANNKSNERVVRGRDTIDKWTSTLTNYSSTSYTAFRPVLEEYISEKVNLNKTLILHNNEYKRWSESQDSTLTISTINAIPIMTSNNTPSGEAIGLADSTSSDAWNAFDGIDTTWFTSDTIGSGKLAYKFNSPKIISKYAITIRNDTSWGVPTSPKDWTFEGSNDGVQWTVLDTRVNESIPLRVSVEFNFINTNSFNIYRINVSKTTDLTRVLSIGELAMYEVTSFTPKTPSSWRTVSTTLPTINQFIDEGMDSLTPLLDRKVQQLEAQEMTLDSTFNGTSESKLFRKKIDLNKYFDLKTIITETRNS